MLVLPCHGLQLAESSRRTLLERSFPGAMTDRRSLIGAVVAFTVAPTSVPLAGIAAPTLEFKTAPTGLQWADAKVGSGTAKQVGDVVAVDYVLSTTGARYGSKIYSTQSDPNTAVVQSSGFNAGAPYRWALGDGSTIAGLEQAVLGDPSSGMPAMLPGGIRRVIIPPSLAYQSLASNVEQANKCETAGVGPVPPSATAFDAFQRFKNIYCNPNRPYQPDVVMDIKMYGKRQ